MNAIEITGLRKAYPDFELAGLDLCQRLTERFVFRAEHVKLFAQRGLSAKTARARARPSA